MTSNPRLSCETYQRSGIIPNKRELLTHRQGTQLSRLKNWIRSLVMRKLSSKRRLLGLSASRILERLSDDGNAQDKSAMNPHGGIDVQPKVVRHYLRGQEKDVDYYRGQEPGIQTVDESHEQ